MSLPVHVHVFISSARLMWYQFSICRVISYTVAVKKNAHLGEQDHVHVFLPVLVRTTVCIVESRS